MKIRQIIILIIGLVLFCTVFFSGCIDPNMITYEVTFDATWSEDTLPDDFPPNPHFSGLIGATHKEKVFFWREGELASKGIKNMAETGSKYPLIKEIGMCVLDQTAFRIISGDGISLSHGSISLRFKICEKYPLVTLVSMIAPSPDWFVGIDSLNLFENGTFVDEKIVTLYAYDAGTDSGYTYTSPDIPTDPPVTIFKIAGYPFLYNEELVPLGTFTFTKITEE